MADAQCGLQAGDGAAYSRPFFLGAGERRRRYPVLIVPTPAPMAISTAAAAAIYGKTAAAIRGLYAITPDEADTSIIAAKVQRAIAGGARLVQYRNKAASPALRKE